MIKKQKNKIYPTKNIYIAHITTMNLDISTKGKITQSALALKQVKIKNQKTLLPVDQFFPYYSIDEVFPISTKMKRTSPWITAHEIEMIVENEKYVQMQQRLQVIKEKEEPLTQEKSTQITIAEQFEQIKENENQKVKKLVA